MIDSLNERFAIADTLEFCAGHGGMPMVEVHSKFCHGQAYLNGAHVTAWQPNGHDEVLWLSDTSSFTETRPIRGGIPICWPWFGDDKTGAGRPAHGFARVNRFDVVRTELADNGACVIEFELTPSTTTRALWPEDFHLSLTVSFGTVLDLTLRMENRSSKPVTHTAALHTYLAISEIKAIQLEGFRGLQYLDKVRDFARDHQAEEPVITGEIDRIYLDTTNSCAIIDPGPDGAKRGRTVQIAKSGSRTTVLWNPGTARAKQMNDLDDAGYAKMLCIEAANAADDCVTLAPGAHHILGTTISIRK